MSAARLKADSPRSAMTVVADDLPALKFDKNAQYFCLVTAYRLGNFPGGRRLAAVRPVAILAIQRGEIDYDCFVAQLVKGLKYFTLYRVYWKGKPALRQVSCRRTTLWRSP